MKRISSYQPSRLIPNVLAVLLGLVLTASAMAATTKPVPVVPLNKPTLTATQISVWANEAAVAVYSHDFANYHRQMHAASLYFTPTAWQDYRKALKKSKNLQVVINHKLVVGAVAQGVPVIIKQGVKDQHYVWRVKMPLLVTYQSASESFSQQVVVTMQIVRTGQFIGQRGVAIERFIVKPVKTKKRTAIKHSRNHE